MPNKLSAVSVLQKSPPPNQPPVYCVRARSANVWKCDPLQVSQAREHELQPCTSYYCGQPAVSASSHAGDTPLSTATWTKNHTQASRGTHTHRETSAVTLPSGVRSASTVTATYIMREKNLENR